MIRFLIFLYVFLIIGCAHKGTVNWRTMDRKRDLEKETKKNKGLDHQGTFFYFVPIYYSKMD